MGVGGLADAAVMETTSGDAFSRQVVREQEKRAMSSDRLISIVRPGTAKKCGGGKQPRPARKSERACARDFRVSVREGDFFFLIGIRLHRVLRADEFKKLVRASKIQFLLDVVLRPASGNGRFCGVERPVINAAHHWNLKMNAGVFLAHMYGGQPADALVGTIEGGYDFLLVVMS